LKQINIVSKNAQSVFLVPIGDVHLGSKYFEEKYLQDVFKFIRKHRDKVHLLIIGDIFESATKTSVGRSVFEENYHLQEQLDKGVELFKPYADLIRVIVTGNHEERITKDTSLHPLKEFAVRLGIEDKYAEFSAIVNFKLGNLVYSTYVWHGSSGAIRDSSVVTAMYKMREKVFAHIYFMGHTHKLMHIFSEAIVPNFDSDEVVRVKQLFVNTGSALANGGYAEQKGYASQRLGYGAVEIFRDKRKMVFHYIEDLI